MFPPLALILTATLSAAVVAYGTHPAWAQYSVGLDFILLSRRLQWPLLIVAVALSLVLVGLVTAGRRKAWWLIGLAPILVLFVHRFATDPNGSLAVTDTATFVEAEKANFVSDADFVVGVQFEGADYAFPFASLYETPAVISAEHDKRFILMWSAFANRAVVTSIGRDLKARDLEVVSTPANALLLYNSRLGQFINGLTGVKPDGAKPTGFGAPLPAVKTTWAQWRAAHPETRVMRPREGPDGSGPTQPLRPIWPMPRASGDLPVETPVVVVGGNEPSAVPSASVTAAPFNTRADGKAVFVFRDPRTGIVRAYDRQLDDADLTPVFRANTDPRRAGAAFVDADTGTGWSLDGIAVTGKKEYRGRRLASVRAEDGLYWGVMKHWYPELSMAD